MKFYKLVQEYNGKLISWLPTQQEISKFIKNGLPKLK